MTGFTPFDPTSKRSDAIAREGARELRISKGAPAAIAALAPMMPEIAKELESLAGTGYRTLAVASGPPGKMMFVGLIADGASRHRAGSLFDRALASLVGDRSSQVSWSP